MSYLFEKFMGEDFDKIYNQYVTRIYRFIFLKVSSQETAEDLCSDVFMDVFHEFQKTQIENTQAFLYQIAKNTIADYYRKKPRFQVISIEETEEIIDTRESVFRKAEINSDMETVKKALRSLSDDHQNLLIWRYLDELSMPEIAQITGKSEGSLRVGIHRALHTLKEKMRQPEEFQPLALLEEEV